MLPTACLLALTVYTSEPDVKAKLLLQSDYYTVKWGEPAKYDPTAELEVAEAHDHAPWNLRWLRFRPGKDGVEVLSIHYCGWKGKKPGEEPVEIQSTRMKAEAYDSLLHALAVVDSATLKEVEREDSSFTWHHLLWQARLTANKKTLLDLNWCGAPDRKGQLKYSKPQATVRLVQEAAWALDWKDHKLTDDERAWASAKFARDWKAMMGAKSAWWLRERALIIAVEVGDPAVVPLLRDILKGEPNDPNDNDAVKEKESEWDDALTATSRLLKKDVRETLLRRVDYDASRKKALELLKDMK